MQDLGLQAERTYLSIERTLLAHFVLLASLMKWIFLFKHSFWYILLPVFILLIYGLYATFYMRALMDLDRIQIKVKIYRAFLLSASGVVLISAILTLVMYYNYT